MRIGSGDFNTAAFRVNSSRQFMNASQVRGRDEKINADKANEANGENANKAKTGGLQDILKSIAERKQGIIDSKKELIDRTLENGGTMKSINESLKMFDTQLKNLEKEKQSAIAQELAKIKEENKQEKVEETQKVEAPKTQQEIQTAKLNETAARIGRFDTIEGSLSILSGMKSRVKVLEGEMEVDGINRNEYERKVLANDGTISAMEPSASMKENEIAKLNANITRLTVSSQNNLSEVVKETNESKAPKPEKPVGDVEPEGKIVAKTETEPKDEIDTYV